MLYLNEHILLRINMQRVFPTLTGKYRLFLNAVFKHMEYASSEKLSFSNNVLTFRFLNEKMYAIAHSYLAKT